MGVSRSVILTHCENNATVKLWEISFFPKHGDETSSLSRSVNESASSCLRCQLVNTALPTSLETMLFGRLMVFILFVRPNNRTR